MPTLHIASFRDIPEIIELALMVWPQTYTHILGEQQVAYMLGRFYAPESLAAQMQDGHTFVLVEHDGLRIGFASFSELEPGLFKLHKLYLLPHTQGHGVGRNVLQQLCVMLRSTGGAQLTLNVNRFNIPAIGFYERNGFLCMGEEDIDIGEGYFMNDYLYTLTI